MLNRFLYRGEFTGWHMLAITLLFFGTIIAVNVTLAVYANRSWTGLVVENSYVASQHFNELLAEQRQQAELGITATLKAEGGSLIVAACRPEARSRKPAQRYPSASAGRRMRGPTGHSNWPKTAPAPIPRRRSLPTASGAAASS